MKTAIVKTGFWEEEDFNELHIDTKLVYTYLLTCPSHGLSQFIKINKAIMSACTGLNVSTIKLGLEQLQELGWIDCYKGYVMLLKNHVEAKKGRFTNDAIERELSDVPDDVQRHFYRYSTCTLPVHKDKDNNIDKNVDININSDSSKKVATTKKEVATIDPVARRIAEEMHNSMSQNFPNLERYKKNADKSAREIEKINRLDGYDWSTIEVVMRFSQNDEFWQQQVWSGGNLRKHFDKLLAKAQSEQNKAMRNVTVL